MPETSPNRTGPSGDPGPDDGARPAWVALIAAGVAVLVVFAAAFVLFRVVASEAAVSLPSGLPPMPTTPTTTTSTVPPTSAVPVVATTPTTVVPTFTVFPPPTTTTLAGDGDAGDDRRTTTTARRSTNRRPALREYADDIGASKVSDIVTIGSTSYALLVVSGDGQLASWDDGVWSYDERVPTPSSITDIETTDVTGDSVPDFVVWLAGRDRPGGVFSRATFDFDFLPFNTLAGRVDFVDGLRLRSGALQSPFRTANGTLMLTWRWTGRMFEAR